MYSFLDFWVITFYKSSLVPNCLLLYVVELEEEIY